jgi:hypothetical protein
MRVAGLCAFVGTCLVVTVAFLPMTTAASPPSPIYVLAKAHGRGAVTVGASTRGLRHSVWLYRLAGQRVASARTLVSCSASSGKRTTWTDEFFRFAVKPRSRHEVWRYASGKPCVITVRVVGVGPLNVELRGH